MVFLAPMLGIAGATLLGGLWGRGVLPGPVWAAAVVLVGSAAVLLQLVSQRRCSAPRTEPRMPVSPSKETGGIGGAEPQPDGENLAHSLAHLLGNVGIGVVLTDPAGVVRHVAPIAQVLLESEGGAAPIAALHPAGTFFGVAVEDSQQLVTFLRFLGCGGESGEGLVTLAGARRQVCWAGRVLSGEEGLGDGRLFLMRDVTEERRFEILKNDFLATLSHELRTPLTSLRGSLQLVVSRATHLEPTDAGLLQIGIKNTERLIRVINDLLDVDALAQGSLAFHFATLEIGDVIRSAVESTKSMFDEREVELNVEVPDTLPAIHGDRDRLLQVVANLLGNAAKYAPKGSSAVVRALACDDGVQVDVEDRGPGIATAEQPHVFERFWRADRSGADSGAGLGLAICRAILARHGGRIWLVSEQAVGTTFSFFLPRSIFRLDSTRPQPADSSHGVSVLLVEDDSDARAVLRTSLERCGCEVIEAATGASGVSVARRMQPALVVLDLLLPDINGYDVLRILKNSGETARIPILAMSVEPERDLARRLGATHVLQKPVDFEAVRRGVAQALRRVGQGSERLVLAVAPTVSRELGALASALAKDGHQVYRAADVGDLTHWSSTNYPDVLVLDEDFLPETCAEAARVLERVMEEFQIPVVTLASATSTAAAEAADEGLVGWTCIRKPISKDDFLVSVRQVLAAHE